MKNYILKRILMSIPLLLCISFVCFVFINLIPSDPAEVALRVRQTPIITEEAIMQVREELGLNDPFLLRYIKWLFQCLRLDFGVSYTNPSTYCSWRDRKMPSSNFKTCWNVSSFCSDSQSANRILLCSVQRFSFLTV